jgi:hypothetical protein
MAKNPNHAGKGRRFTDDLDTNHWVAGEGLAVIREWLKEKKSDQEIAALIGVNRCTITAWKKTYPVFATMFKIERKSAVPELLRHAYEQATGYYKEVEQVDGQGRIVKVKQWFPGNANLVQFFLKNWDQASYRDKWEIDLGGKLPVVLTNTDNLPD